MESSNELKGINKIIFEYCHFPPKYIKGLKNAQYYISKCGEYNSTYTIVRSNGLTGRFKCWYIENKFGLTFLITEKYEIIKKLRVSKYRRDSSLGIPTNNYIWTANEYLDY